MTTVSSDAVAGEQLKAFVERIERLEEEKAAITADIKEIYAEAKGNGFDTKVLRKVIVIRKQDHAERLELESLLDLYLNALGMSAPPRDDDTPLSSALRASASSGPVSEFLAKNGGTISIRENGKETVIASGRSEALMMEAVATRIEPLPQLPFDDEAK